MGNIQTVIDFASVQYLDRTGSLHGVDGKYTTPEQLKKQLNEREQLNTIAEFRRTNAQWLTLRLMAEEIIKLRKLVSK